MKNILVGATEYIKLLFQMHKKTFTLTLKSFICNKLKDYDILLKIESRVDSDISKHYSCGVSFLGLGLDLHG